MGRLFGRVTGTGGLDGLERVLASVARGPVQVTVDRCTHARHRLSRCTGCQDACPFGAIEIPGSAEAGAARVDTEKCRGCGLCIPACPTQAIAPDRWPLPQLGDRLSSLACAPAAHADKVDAVVPCLGAVEPAFWLEAADRPLTLYRGTCAVCPIAGGGQALEGHLAIARGFAALAGRQIEIRVAVIQEDEVTPVAPSQAEEPRVSRRDFFRLAGHEARTDALAAILSTPTVEAWHGGRLAQRTSPRRDALARHLPAEVLEQAGDTSGLPLWQIELDLERCTTCGMCVDLCQERALYWSERPLMADERGDGDFALLFDLLRCDGCKLCVEACPEGANTMRPASPPFRREARALLRGERVRCEVCGEMFLSRHHGSTRCGPCALAADTTLFGLLRRREVTEDGETF